MKNNFFDLTKKTVLITGASGHLGKAISIRCAEAGAFVYLNGRNIDTLETTHQEIQERGGNSRILPFDINDEEAIDNATSVIKKERGKLDGLVNNAFAALKGNIEDTTKDIFQKSFQTNVSSLFSLCQKCISLMERTDNQAHASIVNIASMYGVVSPDPSIYLSSGMNNPPFYGASKAAVIQLSRYLACHIADRGIRTNSLSPGPFPPENLKHTQPDFYKNLCNKTPLKRIGRPEELAAAVHFLLSDDSSYINGVNIPIDGGWTAW